MKLLKLVAMAIALAVTTVSPVLASDVGIVLMHGKWGAASGKSPIGKLKAKLEGAGFYVVTPDMPWLRNRYPPKFDPTPRQR